MSLARQQLLATLVVLLATFSVFQVNAMTRTVDSSMSNSAINAVVHQLVPGDVLLLKNGTYTGVDLQLKDAGGTALAGTAGNPITILGEGGSVIVANTAGFQECILLPAGTQYIVIKNIECTHQPGDTQAGFWLDQNVNNIQILNCVLHDIQGTAIQLNKDNTHTITIKDCHIYNTGLNLADSGNGGYGIWAGGLFDTAPTTNQHDIIVQHNLIHDTNGHEGSCVRLFFGVRASNVIDNVFFNCPRGTIAEMYALVVIGNSDVASDTSATNFIERNLIFNVAGTDGNRYIAIDVCAGTHVINNLIINADYGIVVARETATLYTNTVVLHNTVYGIRGNDVNNVGFRCRDATTSDTSSFIIQNNVFSVAGTSNVYGYRFSDPPHSTAFVCSNNRFDGLSFQELDETTEMIPIGSTPLASIWENPSFSVPGADFRSKGFLVQSGANAGVSQDFDTNPRSTTPDIGCYEAGSGPHWAITANFKGSTAAPVTTGGGGSGGGSSAANDDKMNSFLISNWPSYARLVQM